MTSPEMSHKRALQITSSSSYQRRSRSIRGTTQPQECTKESTLLERRKRSTRSPRISRVHTWLQRLYLSRELPICYQRLRRSRHRSELGSRTLTVTRSLTGMKLAALRFLRKLSAPTRRTRVEAEGAGVHEEEEAFTHAVEAFTNEPVSSNRTLPEVGGR